MPSRQDSTFDQLRDWLRDNQRPNFYAPPEAFPRRRMSFARAYAYAIVVAVVGVTVIALAFRGAGL